MEKVKEWVHSRERVETLKSELKEAQAELSVLEQLALEYMASTGITRVDVDNNTVYISSWIRARLKNTQSIGLLKETEYGNIVKETVNSNTLRALVKEVLEEEGALPPELEKAISYIEVQNLRLRRKQ